MDYSVEIYKQLHDEDVTAPEGKEGGSVGGREEGSNRES